MSLTSPLGIDVRTDSTLIEYDSQSVTSIITAYDLSAKLLWSHGRHLVMANLDGLVVTGSTAGSIEGRDPTDGRRIWTSTLVMEQTLQVFASTDHLYVVSGRQLTAIDRETGDQVWAQRIAVDFLNAVGSEFVDVHRDSFDLLG